MSSENKSFKRKFPRSSYQKKISFVCRGVSGVVEALDLGEGGMSFRLKTELVMGHSIVLNFFTNEDDFFSLKGEIKNSSLSEDGYWVCGVAFVDLDILIKRQLRAFIARSELKNKLLKVS